jgi:putative Holliday junction resolvase
MISNLKPTSGKFFYMNQYVFALGLDIGKKRIGVAGCDGLGLLATGLTTINRRSFQQDLHQIETLIKERKAEILVVGLPYLMDGTLGEQAKQVKKLAQRISRILNIKIEYVDERLTSVEAEEQLKSQKRFSTYNKGLIDQQAAAIILQQWLDEQSR